MHHPSGDCIKTGIRAFNPLFAGRSCTGMRVNRGKGGNTDTSARWEDFWVASGLSTEGEGRSEEPRELPARREAQDPRPSTAVSVPRCHHPTLGASHAVIPDLLPLLKARWSSAAICPCHVRINPSFALPSADFQAPSRALLPLARGARLRRKNEATSPRASDRSGRVETLPRRLLLS